jgi:immune inhibitor A
VNRTANGVVTIKDVKTDRKVYRLWKNGAAGKEYFLLENRQRTLYDRKLPGDGLLVYHIDETIDGNEDENHPFIKLLEADGRNHLHDGANRGDAGDPYPGSAHNGALTNTSRPNAKSYGGLDTCVTVANISAGGASIKARLEVMCSGGSGPSPSSARKDAAGRASATRTARKKTSSNRQTKKSDAARRRTRRR